MADALKPWEAGFVPEEHKVMKPWEPGFIPEEHKTEASTGLLQHKADPHIVEEMSPLFNAEDRVALSMSNDPVEAIKYFRNKYPVEKYPEYELGLQNDRVMAKKHGEVDSRPLSPKFSIFQSPQEYGRQAIDFGPDIAKSAVTTAGALASGPSLGTSMLAAGGLGAGLEAARQQYGKSIGINKELHAGPIAFEGLANAAGPLMFGNNAAKGVVGKTYDTMTKKVAPKVGEFFSGVPAQQLMTAAERPAELQAIINMGKREAGEQVHEGITNTLRKGMQDTWGEMSDKMGQAGVLVDHTPAEKPFQDLLAKAQTEYKENPTIAGQKKIDNINKVINNYFRPPEEAQLKSQLESYLMGKPTSQPAGVSPRTAFALKQDMAALGELAGEGKGLKSNLSGMDDIGEREIAIAARDSKSILDKQIGTAVDTADKTLGTDGGGKTMGELRQKYSAEAKMQDYLNNKFKDRDSTINTLSSLGTAKNDSLARDLMDLDKVNPNLKLLDTAKLFQASNTFRNPSLTPVSSGGTVSTGRMGMAGLVGGGTAAAAANKFGLHQFAPQAFVGGAAVGNAALGPSAMRPYMKLGSVPRTIMDKLGPMNLGIGQTVGNIAIPQNKDFSQFMKFAPNAWTLMKNKVNPDEEPQQ